MMMDEKRDRGPFRKKFKTSCTRHMQTCLGLVKNLSHQSGTTFTQGLSSIRNELSAAEGEAQLLGFKDLAQLFSVLIEALNCPSPGEVVSMLQRGLRATEPLLEHWSAGDSTQDEAEGIVAALSSHLARARKAAALSTAPESTHAPKRIIFVDDSEITRDMIKIALEEEGHVVRVAENLVDFDKVLKEFQPDIILTDVNMPEIRGDQICKVLKTKYDSADIPIVLFSSLDDEELSRLAVRAGADGYISKQQGFDKLIELINQLVNQILW